MSRIQRYFLAVMTMAITMVTMLYGGITALAAGVNISFSDPSAVVGNEVSVKMKVQGADGASISRVDVMLAYDTSMLEFNNGTSSSGGAGAIRVSEASDTADTTVMEFTLNFKALQAGSTSLTITTQEIYDTDNQLISLQNQGTAAIKISALESNSNVAELKELIISPGTLSPAFSADVYEYHAAVGADITKVAVSAVPKEDSKAKVTITGNDQLVQGENKVVCQVTAEDGTTIKNYTILVTKGEGGETQENPEIPSAGDLKVMIQGEEYYIASSLNESSLPEGFEKSSYDYEGQEISIGKGLEKNLILCYLINSSNEGAYYIFDENTKTFTPYVQLETTKKSIVVLAPDPGVALPQGFVESTISIENQIVQGWVWSTETNHEYCIFYAMNWAGEKGFYRFDTKEKTIQRYFQDPALVVDSQSSGQLSETYQQLQQQYQRRLMIIVILIILAVVMFIVTVMLLLKKTKQKARYEEDYSDHEEPISAISRPIIKEVPEEEHFIKELEQREELEKELESNIEAEAEVVLVLDSDEAEEDDDFEYISIDD